MRCDLPFAEVGEVVELRGKASHFDAHDRDYPHRWLLIQAGQYVEREGIHYHVEPKHVIAFMPTLATAVNKPTSGCASIPPSSTSKTRGRDAPVGCGRT